MTIGHQPHDSQETRHVIDMNTMKINNADRNSNILQEAPWQVKIEG